MALNKGALASAIKNILASMDSTGEDQSDYFANSLADAIDTFVKSGQVVGNTSGGSCAYQGAHIALPVIGQVV
jgi:hypothetical protein